MLEGTEREVLELLAERPRSPTEVAEVLGVSVQTASRTLKRLARQRYAERTTAGEGRGYKRYRAREFAHVFAGFDGEVFERNLEIGPVQRAAVSVLSVPEPSVHSILFEYLFDSDTVERSLFAKGIIVYGSVARGEANENSDIDLFVVYDPNPDGLETEYEDPIEKTSKSSRMAGGAIDIETERVVSEEWFSVSEFHDGLGAGSQFLRNVLDEGIVLYDPEEVIRRARQKRASEGVPQ